MAYENGRKINHYFNMKCGKKKSKNRTKHYYNFYWDKEKYWKFCYLSGIRKVCKKQTNKRLRGNKFNGEIFNIPSDYRKVFDYWNTLF